MLQILLLVTFLSHSLFCELYDTFCTKGTQWEGGHSRTLRVTKQFWSKIGLLCLRKLNICYRWEWRRYRFKIQKGCFIIHSQIDSQLTIKEFADKSFSGFKFPSGPLILTAQHGDLACQSALLSILFCHFYQNKSKEGNLNNFMVKHSHILTNWC